MHKAHVVDTPPKDCEAVDAAAKGKTLILRWIEAVIFDNVGMEHSRAHYFDPSSLQLFGYVFANRLHVDLDGWLGEWKERGAETNLDGTMHELREECSERAAQVRERYVAIDHKTIDLREFCLVRHVGRFVAKYFAHRDGAIWRHDTFVHLGFYVARMDGCRVRTQHFFGLIFYKERVLHVACGMIARNIERVEIVPFVFKERTFSKREPHIKKDPVGFANER